MKYHLGVSLSKYLGFNGGVTIGKYSRAVVWYNHFSTGFNEPIRYNLRSDNIIGNQVKVGIQWLLATNELPWLEFIIGGNVGYLNTEINYNLFLEEPTFHTYKLFPVHDNAKVYSMDFHTGFTMVAVKRIELSTLFSIGIKNINYHPQYDIVNYLPLIGFSINDVYYGFQINLNYRFLKIKR